MVNYVYTSSDFRKADPEFGGDLSGFVARAPAVEDYEDKDHSNNWDLSAFAL
jgi:hypothetical protein